MIIDRFVVGSTTYDLSAIYSGEDDAPAGPAYGAYTDSPGGGAHDGYGSTQSSSGQIALRKSGEIIATTRADLLERRDALRAMKGQHGKLYAEMDDETVRWVYARCDLVSMPRSADMTLYQGVDIAWTQKSAVWNGNYNGGSGWLLDGSVALDSGRYLDEGSDNEFILTAGTNTLTLTNNGNAPVTNIQILVTVPTTGAGGADITGLGILSPYSPDQIYDFSVNGAPFLAASALVANNAEIDTGVRSVYRYDGVTESYALLGFNADHKSSDWLVLEPGTNEVAVVLSGGGTGTTIKFTYYDGWS